MKKISWLLPAVLFLSVGARAQETPRWEVGGGYTYVNANFSPNYLSRFTLNGGWFSVQENRNRWFGGRFEFNGFSGTEGGVNVKAQTYTFGPVFSYRKFERFTPYAHAQLGAIHAPAGYLGISAMAAKFALAAGGGVDVAINRRAAIRFQGDYLMTRFLGLRQNNLQVSTGIVIHVGGYK
jgi:hypothetical protein